MISMTTIYHPHYGPHGEPYTVRVETGSRVTLAHYWTEREAWEARDAALDAGVVSVRISGLPTRCYAVTPNPAPLLDIID